MAYLTRESLYTHLYPEVIEEITRSNVYDYANLAAFPATGNQRYYYMAQDTNKYYTWDGKQYNQTAFVDIVQKAINTGIGEAKGYLTRYDLTALFGTDTTSPSFTDDNLDTKVKDLIQWHLIRLCNVNMNYEIAKTAYNDALKFFEKVQKGTFDAAAAGWPLKTDDPATLENDAGLIQWESLPKRHNHY